MAYTSERGQEELQVDHKYAEGGSGELVEGWGKCL